MNSSIFIPCLLSFIFTFALTAIIEKKIIPVLKSKAAQPIYADGPSWHLSKSGTPTMGGIGFLISCSVSALFSLIYLIYVGEFYFATSLIINVLYAVINALIGIIDDMSKIRKKENAGLSPAQKLIFQAAAASVFLISRRFFLHEGTTVYFSSFSFDLGIFYYPICLVMLLGTVNCANLTDGVDGLASGVSFAIFVGISYFASSSGSDASLIAFIIMGATLAFLFFNINPAKIFMGDTGSLFLGAIAASSCFTLGNPLMMLLIGCVYLIEGISVIIQVSVYKISKKRVFRMAPLHHHLEKCGWSENKIVISAIILTLVMSVLAGYIFV